ncbi:MULTISPECIES: phosphate ABC transporter substrate-binding protein [unclassified Mesorhizobium]|uniref:phosphate ABC transporter substrate-binding protein n=1 Tax=unclassified Mesorhizobium TaxID=325217 RepID=UPI000FCA6E1E|nr:MULTISPECIES: phosphate ABC transporter substrate-binding protein [unclassified Mesorhizobium]RUU25565.1 phosphate ABC transporter substrate-binding protein [Mesorhizobium sp. M6A.T.Ce.TU.016.01.1.1]RWN24686.1 MAG: phosphate ABC transporter substrate-binding protein [Mesorhizobium sp.]
MTAIIVALAAWYFYGNRAMPAFGPASGPVAGGSLQIMGSETMRPVVTVCAEAFMADNPEADIIVRGGGSGDGMAALLHGMIDIGMISRPLSPKEIGFATAKGIDLTQFELALDGVAIVVHRTNPLREIDVDQLRAIWSGDLSQWRELSGGPGEIQPLARAKGSGTEEVFAERVLKGQREGVAKELPTNEAIVAEVAAQPNAIGYTGLGALRNASDRVHVLAIRSQSSSVLPSADTVWSGTYPLTRALLLINPGTPSGLAASFIAYCTGPAGQALVKRAGYVEIAAGEP